MPWMQSIQSYETQFGQDLDNDGATGVNLGALTTVSTDTTGDLLKKILLDHFIYLMIMVLVQILLMI